jgi:hypothetical protein
LHSPDAQSEAIVSKASAGVDGFRVHATYAYLDTGYSSATSMIQTGGIAWAWGIHSLQDVVILVVLIAGAEAHRRVSTRTAPPGGVR